MLDDGASACITNDKDDFIEPPKHVDHKVKGINGRAKATHRGTLKWHVDDNGFVHIMVIKGAYFIPDAATRILSPQHLAQQADDHKPKEEGTGALTTSKNFKFFLVPEAICQDVPLDPRTNVGLTTTASDARSFCAFSPPSPYPKPCSPTYLRRILSLTRRTMILSNQRIQSSHCHQRKTTKKRFHQRPTISWL